MRQVKNKRPDRIASRKRVRTRQAAGIGARLSNVSLGVRDSGALGYGLCQQNA
jgi:hypothetical protein